MERKHLLFETVVGSQAYGLAGPGSDRDVKGVYVEPREALLCLEPPAAQVELDRGTVVYYALRRFLALALTANPNIIELLFMPADCVLQVDSAFEAVLRERKQFITRQAYATHVRYAEAQIRKARGRNKWINNPQPEAPPQLEQFCRVIPMAPASVSAGVRAGSMPLRPVALAESGVRLEYCHVAAVEQSRELYRLYDYGEGARGVFRGGQIVCESIPIEDEAPRCIGMLLVNMDAYERAVRDHRNYWEWRANRNEARWESQESGRLDYDAKNMMHLFRLMLSAERILSEGEPLVRFSGKSRQFLLDIRNGHFAYDELIAKAEVLMQRLEQLHAASDLPEQADAARAESLLREVTANWEQRHA